MYYEKEGVFVLAGALFIPPRTLHFLAFQLRGLRVTGPEEKPNEVEAAMAIGEGHIIEPNFSNEYAVSGRDQIKSARQQCDHKIQFV